MPPREYRIALSPGCKRICAEDPGINAVDEVPGNIGALIGTELGKAERTSETLEFLRIFTELKGAWQ